MKSLVLSGGSYEKFSFCQVLKLLAMSLEELFAACAEEETIKKSDGEKPVDRGETQHDRKEG